MIRIFHRLGRLVLEPLHRFLAMGFEPELNPLRHLGALTIFFLWIVLVSGIWLLIFFDTSASGAYASVEYLTHSQWYLGGVMRSLHRYASDGAIITLALHMLKEFSQDRYRDNRWFSWSTGVPLIWLLIPLGFTGYWLVWDELAQYVALTSAELLDALPIFTGSMARNFLTEENLSDRFFTLMAFLHLIGMPLFLVLGIWLHVFRISGPRINPPRALMSGTLLAMLLLSLAYPAVSHAPADLARVPASLGMDWYYLLVYPLAQLASPAWLWALLLAITALLFAAPWLPPARAVRPAAVDLDNCNGCQRCVDDCPFDAVAMVPRSDGKTYAREAVVDPDLCISCGICVGACPTSTPFRSRSALRPGIDLPGQPLLGLRESLHGIAVSAAGPGVIAVACKGKPAARSLMQAGAPTLEVTCLAQLPPSFLDYALNRGLAQGVLLAGCGDGDCQFRRGTDWTAQRIDRLRDPHLRERVDRGRLALSWRSPWSSYSDPVRLYQAFASELAGQPPKLAAGIVGPRAGARVLRWAARALAYAALALIVGWLSSSPAYQLLAPGHSVVALSISHAGRRLEDCRRLTQEELDKLPPNMRTAMSCPRGRHPVAVELRVDGQTLYAASLRPSGLWDDGESTIYRRLSLSAGEHLVWVGLRDSGPGSGFDHQAEAVVRLQEFQQLVIDFDNDANTFTFR